MKGTGGWELSGILRTVVGASSVRSSDFWGQKDREHKVGLHGGTLWPKSTRAIGRLSGGNGLRILCAEGEIWHGHWILQHY